MKSSLAGRLARIRSSAPAATAANAANAWRTAAPDPSLTDAATSPPVHAEPSRAGPRGVADFLADGWTELDPLVLQRSIRVTLDFTLPPDLSAAFSALAPSSAGVFAEGAPLPLRRLLLFDLETTGLSGGAGTVAFLAAFGRFIEGALTVSQYLLLDYPGESVFVSRLLAEFEGRQSGGLSDRLSGGRRGAEDAPVLATYNGKSFDMQLLRTRCLMNGEAPPQPDHLDLVHPARRLWRRALDNCSLATIEREVLGIDRGADLGGAEAPDAWFDFLKRGETDRLKQICAHNARDLVGLAGLLARLDRIVRDPLGSLDRPEGKSPDAEALALSFFFAAKKVRAPLTFDDAAINALLEAAVSRGSFRAAFALARARGDRRAEARELLRAVAAAAFPGRASDYRAPAAVRAAAYRLLAREALRVAGDRAEARCLLDDALALADLPAGARVSLVRLRERC